MVLTFFVGETVGIDSMHAGNVAAEISQSLFFFFWCGRFALGTVLTIA